MGSSRRTTPGPPSAADLADAFSHAAKSLVRRFDERLGEHGVSTPRSRLVLEVARLQPVRLSDLADAVGISQGTASSLVEALVKDGLLRREPDATDRRVVRLSTTADGATFAATWATAYAEAAEELMAAVPRSRWNDLMDLLGLLSREG